jgi:hypothetical protein
MNNLVNKYSKYLNFFLIFGIIFSLQIWLSYIFIAKYSINDSDKELKYFINRVQSDINYSNGKWDISKYVSDPLTPNPHGSGGYTNPLYIITNDGFVIERNSPIGGLLDSSDYKHLKLYTEPQYTTGIANEKWRVKSKILYYKNKEVGILFVAHYNPSQYDTEAIDIDLNETINRIESDIKFTDTSIDVSKVDIRYIPYDISFEVVDTFNKVLFNNGRTPTYIDSSYVHDEFRKNLREIKDIYTGENFLVQTSLLRDNEGKPSGIIVAGTSLKLLNNILNKFILISLIIDILLIGPIVWIAIRLINKNSLFNKIKSLKPINIKFDKHNSTITVDKNKLDLPYASNQYYLCEKLFSKPNKRWEQDELLESFGEEVKPENNRKIYDAAIAINKRLSIKLITYHEKTYRINSEYLPAVLQASESSVIHK